MPINIGFTSQFYFCSLPLRMDTYRSCPNGCVYCFSNYRSGKYARDLSRMEFDLEKCKKEIRISIAGDHKARRVDREAMMKGIPFHLGGLSDGFIPIEDQEGKTEAMLCHLADINYPAVVSTKANCKSLLNFPKIDNVCFQISLTVSDEDKLRVVEPHSSTYKHRLKVIDYLKGKGFWVSARIQPFLPGLTTVDIAEDAINAGVDFVTMEHFKPIKGWDIKANLTDAQPNDRLPEEKLFKGVLDSMYPKPSEIKGGAFDYLFKSHIKMKNYAPFIEKFKAAGIPYGIGDNDLMLHTTGRSCCGVDYMPEMFQSYWKANLMYLLSDPDKTDFDFTDLEALNNLETEDGGDMNGDLQIKGYRPIDYLKAKWNNDDNSSDFTPEFFGLSQIGWKDGMRTWSKVSKQAEMF